MKLLSLLLLLFVSGCALSTMQFTSSYNQKTKITLSKTIIICEGSYRDIFMKIFADTIGFALQQKNIQSKIIVVNELSYITQPQIEQAIKDFNADAVITLRRNEYRPWGRGFIYGDLYFGIKKAGEDADFWKAMIVSEQETYHSDGYVYKTVNDLLNKFQSDAGQ